MSSVSRKRSYRSRAQGALDDTAQLLGPDLIHRIDAERNWVGQVRPDVSDYPLLDGLDALIRCDIQLDAAWLARSEGTDIGDRGCIRVGEVQVGEFCVLPGRVQHVADRSDRRGGASLDDCEIQIGRVAIVADVNKPERSSALEYQTASVHGVRTMKLGDDVSQDVVPLHDRCIDSVCVGPPRNGVACEHD